MRRRNTEPITLSDHAVVLRGGVMRLDDLRRNAEDTRDKLGRPGLSVFGADGMSAIQLLQASGLSHGSVRVSRLGALRKLGLEIEPTLRLHHLTIWLPTSYRDGDLMQIQQAFAPPVRREELAGTGRFPQV